jgi:hypothetical protein
MSKTKRRIKMTKKKKKDALSAALEIVSNVSPTQNALRNIPAKYREESLALLEETNPWSTGRNIIGFGIAGKKTVGKQLGEICLKVYVKKKLPSSKLSSKKQIPSSLKIFDQSEEVITDVEELGTIKPQGYDGRYRPALPGCSVSHIAGRPGTFGCVVHKDGQRFLLSCSHVVAMSGAANIGDLILQPNVSDPGNNIIGRLAEFVPFDFSSFPGDQVDAGLVSPTNDSLIQETFIDGTNAHESRSPLEGMQVQLIGFVSGHTLGQVVDTFFRFTMTYPTGSVAFSDQILCTKMSAEGDSGSLLMDMENHAVGLLIGGSFNSSVCNPIRSILRKLDVEIP